MSELSGQKSWWQSKTIWLALLAAASQVPRVGQVIGAVDPETVSAGVEGALSVVTVITGALAARTRATATERVSSEPVRRG